MKTTVTITQAPGIGALPGDWHAIDADGATLFVIPGTRKDAQVWAKVLAESARNLKCYADWCKVMWAASYTCLLLAVIPSALLVAIQ